MRPDLSSRPPRMAHQLKRTSDCQDWFNTMLTIVCRMLITLVAISASISYAATSGSFDVDEPHDEVRSGPIAQTPDTPTDPRILDEIRRRSKLLFLECKLTTQAYRDDGSSTSKSSFTAIIELDLEKKGWRRFDDDDGYTDAGALIVTENDFIMKQDATATHTNIKGKESLKIDRIVGKFRMRFAGSFLGRQVAIEQNGECAKTNRTIPSNKF